MRKCERNPPQRETRSKLKQAEEALRQSEETFRALLNFITDVALFLDEQGTVLAANQQACGEHGAGCSDLMGLNIRAAEALKIADEMLYRAKRDGRDRVESWP